MQISIMEISMSLNGNLGLSWGITQPTEKITFLKFYLVRKLQKLDFFNFPRSNLKIKLEGSTHIQPVPPIQLPCSQIPMTIYNDF